MPILGYAQHSDFAYKLRKFIHIILATIAALGTWVRCS